MAYVIFSLKIPELLRFVLGQGHTVKVLKSAELIEMVKDEAKSVRGLYGAV